MPDVEVRPATLASHASPALPNPESLAAGPSSVARPIDDCCFAIQHMKPLEALLGTGHEQGKCGEFNLAAIAGLQLERDPKRSWRFASATSKCHDVLPTRRFHPSLLAFSERNLGGRYCSITLDSRLHSVVASDVLL